MRQQLLVLIIQKQINNHVEEKILILENMEVVTLIKMY